MSQRSPGVRREGPRIRVDDRGDGSTAIRGRGVSGRWFVGAAVVGLLMVWGALYVLFWFWRSGVEERIAFGKNQVLPIVTELAALEPPGIDRNDWLQAVADTETMLEEVVGTGRMDRSRLQALRSDLERRVVEAHRSPELAPEILARIWDDMALVKRFRSETERPELIRAPDERPGDSGIREETRG
ncbi:hypothetical protein [Tautonia marina]|uniref:hypothetical protein n=1 Tax=Tautonia marina TaxID=2653855 RepID=UPI00126101CE|nr:hypothetical protein [Tautonia marina]